MDNRNIKVAIIFGGGGCEHDVSIMGAENLIGAVRSRGFGVIPTLVRRDGAWFVADEGATVYAMERGECALYPTFPIRLADRHGLLVSGELVGVDAAIPLLHGERGEDGRVQGLLACAGIPFVGCDTVCGAICSDKAVTKLIARELGIPTAKGVYSCEYDTPEQLTRRALENLEFPMFVKPTRLGSSVGAGAAYCRSQLTEAVERAYALGSGRATVEEMIRDARELECAVFSINGKLFFTNIGEISYSRGFYDYDTKYSPSSDAQVITSAAIAPEVKSRILEYSQAIARAVGVRGLSRIDFFLDAAGGVYFNEINTFPGMTARSMFARLVEASGAPLAELFEHLIAEAAV